MYTSLKTLIVSTVLLLFCSLLYFKNRRSTETKNSESSSFGDWVLLVISIVPFAIIFGIPFMMYGWKGPVVLLMGISIFLVLTQSSYKLMIIIFPSMEVIHDYDKHGPESEWGKWMHYKPNTGSIPRLTINILRFMCMFLAVIATQYLTGLIF